MELFSNKNEEGFRFPLQNVHNPAEQHKISVNL
jgi:hypothetical protein